MGEGLTIIENKRRKKKVSPYVKKKKETKASIFRRWFIPESVIKGGGWNKVFRYQNPIEKGIYWWHFSREVRKRDVAKWGTCISCGRPITIETSQAGHFMPAEDCGRDLLFDERNVNAECSRCNAWDETHLLGYAENLDKRYGVGTAFSLRKRRQEYKDKLKRGEVVKDWKREEYEQKLYELQQRTV